MSEPADVIREALAAVAYGSWAPEAQRPDARVALTALTELEERCEDAWIAANDSHEQEIRLQKRWEVGSPASHTDTDRREGERCSGACAVCAEADRIAKHPGEHCQRCGRAYAVVWAAENDLWNEVIGSSAGLRCPDCFDTECRERGLYPFFACHREHVRLTESADLRVERE